MRPKVKRALISRLFAMDLKQLLQLEQTAEGLSQFMTGFDTIRELWSAQGFLVAWQQCLNLIWHLEKSGCCPE